MINREACRPGMRLPPRRCGPMTRFFHRTRHDPAEIMAETPERTAPAPPIELIVGLGNPGSEYAGNRHNVGFWTVNRLGRRLGIDVKKHSGLASVGEGTYAGRRLVL